MYDELVKRLKEDKSWVEQGTTQTEHEIAEHIQQAADAIEDLSGFVQEAERDRDEYKERLDKVNDAIEFLRTYKTCFDDIVSMGGWWLVGKDKNLYRMNVPMNWPPKGTKVIEPFPLPEPPEEGET